MICHYCKHPIVKGQWQKEARPHSYAHLNVQDCQPTLSESQYHAALVEAERERCAKIVTENFHLSIREVVALIEGSNGRSDTTVD